MPVIQRRGIRALQIWCQRATSGYAHVDVTDLTSSFKSGLAFCAIIHHYRPDLIDYASLRPEDVLENNRLAFAVAEEKLDIPALLDPQDMVDFDEPDKFSVVTYVSQFYHHFKAEDASPRGSPIIGGSLLLNRTSESSENDSLFQSSTESTPTGTPTPTKKSAAITTQRRTFNQAELIAKYGEEIFSKSSSSSSSGGGGGGGIDAVCNDLVQKAKISEERRKN